MRESEMEIEKNLYKIGIELFSDLYLTKDQVYNISKEWSEGEYSYVEVRWFNSLKRMVKQTITISSLSNLLSRYRYYTMEERIIMEVLYLNHRLVEQRVYYKNGSLMYYKDEGRETLFDLNGQIEDIDKELRVGIKSLTSSMKEWDV